EATQKLAVINDRRAEVEERIRALRLELDAAEQAAAFVPPPDPVQQWSFGNPSFVPGPPGPAGRPVMQVVGAPEFELDDRAAATAQSAMTEAQAATAARPERMRAQLAAVEAGLATVRAATTASDPSSFASYTRLHSDAVEAIEHQHAANVDFRMRRRTWTQAKLDTLDVERAGLEQRLDAKLLGVATYQQTAQNADWKRRRGTAQDLDAIATKRAEFLSGWTKDQTILSRYQAAAAAPRDAINVNASKLLADPTDGAALGEMDIAIVFFRDKAKSFGLDGWWSVAHAGLTTARDGAAAQVDAANSVAVPVIRAMRDMHARITTDLDSLNRRQAELYGVLYDLYDAYLRTYGAQDSPFNTFTARKAALAVLLQTPTISSPRVTVTDFGYLSSINTTWSGSHPNGVYEFLLQDGADSLFTVGAQGQARRWAYTTEQAGGSTPRNQTLFVRGGAGFTASALTPYTVTFRQGSAANPITQVAVPPPDLTPPGRPVVELPDLMTRVGTNGEPELWTGDSSRIFALWCATDVESGIAEYQYRVLSWPLINASTGGTQMVGFQSLNTLQPVSLTQWVSAGGRTSVSIVGLNLPPNRNISVEVRATNGTGLTGDNGGSPALRYDPTPPQFPAGTTLSTVLAGKTSMPSLTGAYVLGAPPMLPVCGLGLAPRSGPATKVWDGRLVLVAANDAVVGATAQARVVLSRPTATDPETGIGGYNYRVDSVPPTSTLPVDGWRDILETGSTFTATGPAFAYGRPRWVTLVALNQTGRRSAPITVGPFTVGDMSAPSAPVFCADYAQGGFIAYLTTPSVDEESGVRGYQVRVRGNGGAIVRDFPANGAIDWPATQALANTGVRLAIPPGSGLHTVELRAVNGVGAAGSVAQSGQMLIDATPPPVAGATGTLSLFGATINLTLANDPESGLAGVDIAFGGSPTDPTLEKGGSLVMPYTTYPAVAGLSKKVITFPSGTVLTPALYAYIRVRNGAGLLSAPVSVRIR
ncbi:MAG: hypothetical protein ACYC0B_06385, partial [Gemmatimonadaceae bacterium]